MLTTSASVSARVLLNPETTSNPHLQFMEEVVTKVSSLKENGLEIAFGRATIFIRLFVLGKPNSKGEPTPGSLTEKVLIWIKDYQEMV